MVLTNPRHEHFAQLIASGAIAARAYVAAGFSESGAAQSANRLLKDAKVRARITELQNEISAGMVKASIRDKNARVKALQDRWDKLHSVMSERAADPAFQSVPGGRTGLLARTLKVIGGGDSAREVEEFEIDAVLLKELREHELQAAKELAQFTERHEHSGPGGGAIAVTDDRLRSLSDEDLALLQETLKKIQPAT